MIKSAYMNSRPAKQQASMISKVGNARKLDRRSQCTYTALLHKFGRPVERFRR